MGIGVTRRKLTLILCVLTILATSLFFLGSFVLADQSDPQVQLCIIVDGSGSIEPEDWAITIEGLADAIGNPDCTPQDGSLELAIVVFGWFPDDWHAEVALAPIVITSANADDIADDIRAIVQPYGNTPMACGLRLAADTLYNSPNFDPDIKQSINLVTDGIPNVPCDTYQGQGQGLPPWPPPASVYENTVDARNYLLDKLEMEPSRDEIDAEYVGIPDEYAK